MKRFLTRPVLVIAVVAVAMAAWAASRPRTYVCIDCNPVPNSLPNDALGLRPDHTPDTMKGTLR